ncbi:unnamed protein product, partial [Amoebophrya sp. A120]
EILQNANSFCSAIWPPKYDNAAAGKEQRSSQSHAAVVPDGEYNPQPTSSQGLFHLPRSEHEQSARSTQATAAELLFLSAEALDKLTQARARRFRKRTLWRRPHLLARNVSAVAEVLSAPVRWKTNQTVKEPGVVALQSDHDPTASSKSPPKSTSSAGQLQKFLERSH